jgi:hypothetical protein
VLKCCFDQHHMIARIVTMIEMYHTLLKQHICNLNRCDLDKIGLSGYDLGQDVIQITLMARFDHGGSLGRKE